MPPAPYRLALIITELDVGGAELCLANLACRLDRSRFEPTVYALGPPPADSQRQLVAQLEAAQVPVRFCGARSAWDTRSCLRQLKQGLQTQRPHLVQTFLFHANLLGSLAAWRAKIPRCVLGLRVADPDRWRQMLERQAARLADRIVCVSQSVAELAQQSGLPSAKLVVIPNGLELDQYPAKRAANLALLGVPEGRQAILYVGRLHRQKGLDRLINLAPELLDQLPQFDLLLVGSGPQQQELELQVRALGIADRVHFAGWRNDVREILRASQMLVLPSRWEGMPNVLLEAMASRLPVVTTGAAGVREILGPLYTQQAAELDNRGEFLRRVIAIGQDAEFAAQLGAANRQRVQQCFALESAIAAYQALYLSLLDQSAEM